MSGDGLTIRRSGTTQMNEFGSSSVVGGPLAAYNARRTDKSGMEYPSQRNYWKYTDYSDL